MDKLLFKQLASQSMRGTLDSWQMCLSDRCSSTSVRLFSSWRCFWLLWSQHHQGWNSTLTDWEKPTNTSENRELGCPIACQLEAVHWSPWKQTGFGKLIEFGDRASSKVNSAELWHCNRWGIAGTNSSWVISGIKCQLSQINSRWSRQLDNPSCQDTDNTKVSENGCPFKTYRCPSTVGALCKPAFSRAMVLNWNSKATDLCCST